MQAAHFKEEAEQLLKRSRNQQTEQNQRVDATLALETARALGRIVGKYLADRQRFAESTVGAEAKST